ncbi:MAG: hypothetical protein AAB374_00935 [Patescibacteria group bacterium]
MIEIVPAILATTKEEFSEMVKEVEPYVSLVHVDISDGIFVDSKTISLEEIRDSSSRLKLSAHLMVQQPETVIAGWLKLPNLQSVIFQIEATGKTAEIIDTIHNSGKKVGLAINPETNIESLEPFVSKIDQVQFMTVHPGNYGGEFVEGAIEKIVEFHKMYPTVKIAVDGSIHKETAQMAVRAGAEILILGSHIFSEGRDIGEAIKELKMVLVDN